MADADAGLSDIIDGRDAPEVETLEPQPLVGEDELEADNAGSSDHDEPAAKTKDADDKADKAAGDKKSAKPAPDPKSDADDTDTADPHPVPRKALIEERKKRQELERKLAELQGQISVYSRQAPTAPAAAKQDAQSEDDEFFSLGPSGYVRKKLSDYQQQLRNEMQQAVGAHRVEVSRELMRSVHEDYEELETEFVELARDNDTLKAQLRANPNPAKFVYEYMNLHRQVRDMGSVDELKTKLREEVRQELLAEQRKESAKADAARVSTSSAGARSASTARVDVGEIPLSEILGA